jgi:hypothetical protein
MLRQSRESRMAYIEENMKLEEILTQRCECWSPLEPLVQYVNYGKLRLGNTNSIVSRRRGIFPELLWLPSHRYNLAALRECRSPCRGRRLEDDVAIVYLSPLRAMQPRYVQ